MAVRRILRTSGGFPTDRLMLRTVARGVGVNELEAIIPLAQDLHDTLDAHPNGVGLAATQVGVHRRVCVIHYGGVRLTLINPVIVEASDERANLSFAEGCLSVPDKFAYVSRAKKVRVGFLDVAGTYAELDCEDELAVIVQHELDHLTGTLFTDRVKPILEVK